MYEFETIFLFALLFLIVYFIGSYRNRKIAVKYARAIKEHLAPRSEYVGFRPYGRGGFRTLCRMKEGEALTKIEMAVSLIDRENLMHYPLSLLTKDCDCLVCWGYLKDAIPLDIEILPRLDKKSHKKITMQKHLKEVAVKESKLKESFMFLASHPNVAERFLADSIVERRLIEAGDFVKRLSLDKNESRVCLMGELKDESLRPLLDLLFCCAEQPIRVQ